LKRTTSEQISFDLECSRNPSALLNNILWCLYYYAESIFAQNRKKTPIS
jgi:hypothetical protein